MKTKILNTKIPSLFIVTALLFLTVSYANAASWGNSWGSSSESGNTCPSHEGGGNTSCQNLHNNGYDHDDFPYGTSWPTFNGYTDMKDADGQTIYNERQMALIERPAPAGQAKTGTGRPTPPWSSSVDYDYTTGDYYKINFGNDPNETVRIGLWGYIHNNGEADLHPAYNTTLKLGGVDASEPQLTYMPSYLLKSPDAKPEKFWGKVKIDGNKPFILELKEGYIYRASSEGGRADLTTTQLQQLVSATGMPLKNDANGQEGYFESSDLHMVYVYVEFEASQEQEEKLCRSLRIIDPAEADDNVMDLTPSGRVTIPANGYENEQIALYVDADEGVVSGYEYNSPANGIKFREYMVSTNDTDVFNTSHTYAYMNGDLVGNEEKITVYALDQDGERIVDCADAFILVKPYEHLACDEFATDPGRTHTYDLKANEPVSISVDTILNTDGQEYRDPDGKPAIIEYCYSGEIDWDIIGNGIMNAFQLNEPATPATPVGNILGNIPMVELPFEVRTIELPEWLRHGDLTPATPVGPASITLDEEALSLDLPLVPKPGCVWASPNQVLNVTPLTAGTMTIVVASSPDNCNDEFDVTEELQGEQCEGLLITENQFGSSPDNVYNVTVTTTPPGLDDTHYNVEWSVMRQGVPGAYKTIITEGNVVDLDNAPGGYNWKQGDALAARAINISDPDGSCMDILEGQPPQQCISLAIEQENLTENPYYSVEVITSPPGTPFRVQWQIVRDNDIILNKILNGMTIDLSMYPEYSYRTDDILRAQAIDINNSSVCKDEKTTLPEVDEECTRFRLDTNELFWGKDQEVCYETDYEDFTYLSYETSEDATGRIQGLNLDKQRDCFIITEEQADQADRMTIWVPDFEQECNDELIHEVKPPDFNKFVRDEEGSSFVDKVVANFNDEWVEYELTYEHHNSGVQDVTIEDTIGREGEIKGYIGTEESGGKITYRSNSMEITVDNDEIKSCRDVENDFRDDGLEGEDLDDAMDDALCYEGSIGDRDGVLIKNVPNDQEVRITYKGDIDSAVDPKTCSDKNSIFNDLGICGETYDNVSRFKDTATPSASGSDLAQVTIPCPFIIIRAGGDVFLENPFDYGVDTLACADIANADVPIIRPDKPATPGLSATGQGTQIVTQLDDRICKDTTTPGYGDIERISSLICEITLKTAADLTQRAIVVDIDSNVQKVARYNPNLNNGGQPYIYNEISLPRSSNNVWVKDDKGDLIFGEGSDVIFKEGAKTFIVKNGNVVINNNLIYDDSDVSLINPAKVPSIAIIVMNGNIIIGPNVTTTVGVWFVQEGADKIGTTGQICENTCTDEEQYNDKQLVHYGSIYGDIQQLFKYRTNAGNPSLEAGAIVIRFDNRVYLNTPPVINDLSGVQLQQTSF